LDEILNLYPINLMEKIMSTFSRPAGQTSNQNIILDAIGESANIAGELITNNGQPSILTQNKFNAIEVETTGFVSSNTSAIQVQGFGTVIDNEGTIYGAVNGINIADDNSSSAVILNEGTISSASRGINIGGVGATVFNSGLITTTANPRNGTIYGDVTAQNVFIINQTNGIIDVGAGLNGDAISLELGANVNGTIRNEGLIQGRGVAGVANPINQAAAVHLYWVSGAGTPTSTFNGDIINSGILAAESGAAVIIEENVIFNGSIDNSGTIISANPANGTGILLENGSQLIGQINNSGTIDGGRDGVNFANGGQVNGILYNTGIITSASRAVNIGGDRVTLINDGLITTTVNPRNGTVYGDVTAKNIFIENKIDGVIDVGAGLNGDAVSLELGAEVNGSIYNEGLIQGRGIAGVAGIINEAAAIHLYWVSASGASV
jgi:hypothetical protein